VPRAINAAWQQVLHHGLAGLMRTKACVQRASSCWLRWLWVVQPGWQSMPGVAYGQVASERSCSTSQTSPAACTYGLRGGVLVSAPFAVCAMRFLAAQSPVGLLGAQ
jgi:hypothetical protein